MFFTVEEAQAAQAKEEKLKMTKYSLQININTDRLIHRRELYSSPMLNNFLKENQTKTNEQTNNNKKERKQRKIKMKLENKAITK